MATAVPDLLERRRKIEGLKDWLVEKVEAFFRMRAEGEKPPEEVVPIEGAQWANLLRLAMATTSVKEVQLYIRYQEGRDREAVGWRRADFGGQLRVAIDGVVAVAGGDPALAIELVRLFLGYLAWEARYLRPEET